MTCKSCDCVPCMCGKRAYPGTLEGDQYEKEVEEFRSDPDLERHISDNISRDMQRS